MHFKNKFRAVSLFSGAGGMDVGFARAGVEAVFANDIDPDACQSYRLNLGEAIHEGDISHFKSTIRNLSDIDFVFGGPPCQGFSVAGKMDPGDQRNVLIRSFFDVVDLAKPRAFVCENVKALAVLSRWKGVRESLLRRATKRYVPALLVLRASDFGVPQSRERMFLIGVRQDITTLTPKEFEVALADALQRRMATPPSSGEVIRLLGREGGPTNHRICRAKITFAKQPVLRRSAYAGMLFNGAGRPINAKGSAPTLPASMGGNKTPIVDEGEVFEGRSSYIEAYHARLMAGGTPRSGQAPKRLRRMTVDECLAMQTFPQGYALSGSQSSMYKQIGNAVPCMLAKVVAESVIEVMHKIDHELIQTAAGREPNRQGRSVVGG